MSGSELLAIGDEGRPRQRPPLSRRTRIALLVLVATIAGSAVVVDHQLRRREEVAIAACAREVATAVGVAGRRVQSIYEYVRPTLAGDLTPASRDGLFLLLAKAARGADAELASPDRTCSAVSVLPVHGELRARRTRCLAVLGAQREGLRTLADDGESVAGWMQLPRSC